MERGSRILWYAESSQPVPRARKLADADKVSNFADRAERDVHAGEAQDALGCGLFRRRRWWQRAEMGADGGQRAGLAPRGEPTVGAHLLEAARQDVPFLGEVPIFTEIREGGDRGMPIVVSAPNHAAGKAFIRAAQMLREKFN